MTIGKYEEIGAELGRLVDGKQKAYGRSFESSVKALMLLAPGGVRPDQYNLILAFARSWDKWSRLFSDPDAYGEEPRKDLAGYSLLLNADMIIEPRPRLSNSSADCNSPFPDDASLQAPFA